MVLVERPSPCCGLALLFQFEHDDNHGASRCLGRNSVPHANWVARPYRCVIEFHQASLAGLLRFRATLEESCRAEPPVQAYRFGRRHHFSVKHSPRATGCYVDVIACVGMVSVTEKPRIRVPTFVSALLDLNERGATGVLEVAGGGVVTLVYVAEGVPVFAEEGTLGETLGRVLLREMQLTEDEYRKVLEHMTMTPMGSEQLRFGEVAVLLGFLTEQQIQEALAMQVVAKLARCMQWADVEATFREDVEALRDVSHHPCPTELVVLTGVSRYYDSARCEAVWRPIAELHPELVEDIELLQQSMRLPKAQRKFLEILDGTRTVPRMIDAAPIDVVRASQLLTALLYLDAMELHAEALEPRSRRPPPLLVVNPRPSRFPQRRQPSLPPLRPDRRAPSKPPKDRQARLRAEHHFRCGQKSLRDLVWDEAVEQFNEALKLDPCAEYRLYAKWAHFNTLTHLGDRLMARSQLRADAVQALRSDRTLGIAHYVLAELALLDQDVVGAKRALALAARFEPNCPEVIRLAERLTH